MTTPPPLSIHERVSAALGTRYRLDALIAANRERVLFAAYDTTLNRPVSLRVNFYTDERVRRWFLREAEAIAQLDHPAIRRCTGGTSTTFSAVPSAQIAGIFGAGIAASSAHSCSACFSQPIDGPPNPRSGTSVT